MPFSPDLVELQTPYDWCGCFSSSRRGGVPGQGGPCETPPHGGNRP
uniref:Uncharacterized protein n=1 Tax=Arundo donax TaxID=35708 RepID=A0A0A8ZNG8_ARUDO